MTSIPRDAAQLLLRGSAMTLPQTAAQWRVGQVLEAVVRDSAGGQTNLQIGRETLSVRSEAPLRAGERVRLEITALRPEVTVTLQRTGAADPLSEASRALLPRQMPANHVLAGLQGVLADPPRAQALPAEVRTAGEALLRAVPEASSLSRPTAVRQAVENSGVYFEHKVAALQAGTAPPAVLQGDVKGLLGNFLNHVFRALTTQPRSSQGGEHPPPAAARPAPPTPAAAPPPAAVDTGALLAELARQADGALARVQTTQINLLVQDGQPPWLFELPVRHGDDVDVLQLLLDREGDGAGDGERAWSVRLSFDFRELGPLHCLVVLRGGEVTTSWWAERQATAGLVDEHLSRLAERMRELGLDVGGMRCVHGKPPAAAVEGTTPGGRLLDERA